tara:strand:- start:1192 stop:1395 length:204 start_codon:yes stop_codon:yes gene_type:complete
MCDALAGVRKWRKVAQNGVKAYTQTTYLSRFIFRKFPFQALYSYPSLKGEQKKEKKFAFLLDKSHRP